MQVRIRLFGEYAKLAGKPEWSVEVAEGADLREAISAFDVQSGQPMSQSLLFQDQVIMPSIAMMVNGKNVLLKDGLRTQLGDGDQISVMPLLGGGSL